MPRGETLEVEMELTLEGGEAALRAGLPTLQWHIGEK